MLPIEPLGLSANHWQFLNAPERYVHESGKSGRPLVPESTRRQFATAKEILCRLSGSYGRSPVRGLLLADDVGLGKTTVAALVAWVVASAGEKRGVRILAPNDVMARRWQEELLSHVDPLQECAPALDVRRKRVKARRVDRLSAGSIQVVKHSYAASDFNLTCDLLIVDEAHRAKGENTAFSNALRKQRKHAARVLILTATPFSIQLDELERMLTLVGGDEAKTPVRGFSRALDDLYRGSTARAADVVADRLADKAQAAVEALSQFVIRHSIEDLPNEQAAFGNRADWRIQVPRASRDELELMLRMDRALRVTKQATEESLKATNDPRFHVGWRHFDAVRRELQAHAPSLPEPARAVVRSQLERMKPLREGVGIHSKMRAVAAEVVRTIERGEKVLLFCHHHATAQELTLHLASKIPALKSPRSPSESAWRDAWDQVLVLGDGTSDVADLRETFIRWLCSDLVRAQTWNWIAAAGANRNDLPLLLATTNARSLDADETIAAAAVRLFRALLESKSSHAVLKDATHRLELLPGADPRSRVVGVCPSVTKAEAHLFLHNQQPDTIISIFNSPFGPDVLVVTDRLSEGIDLHRYCRHLVHYELDPSPIRTVQRNGRLRRVNSWASVVGEPILYAYPAFAGTRDHRVVQIMKKRIDSFALLLGGVQDFDVDEVVGSDEAWRNEVITIAKRRLSKLGGRLRVAQERRKRA